MGSIALTLKLQCVKGQIVECIPSLYGHEERSGARMWARFHLLISVPL